MRRNLVLAGLIIMLVAVVMYFSAFFEIHQNTVTASGTLQPGQSVQESFSYKEDVITVIASPPVTLNVNVQGNVVTQNVFNNAFVAIATGSGNLIVQNNYTSPVKVDIVVANLASPIALFGILSLLGIVLGIAGVVVLVIGVLRKEK
ncbi:hypothetical protein L3N51_01061 [Metallosphaera sp. J1]|uniref:hypothetical protein n=1 Tax=Metallosphaera TaxID=41980 RepID=UPI001EE0E09C|nr:hypothetical protein [Metallosphaera javensis (ex Hofmann et al. 2022)]MCG3108775.1 hypothetical protein [Metallosphaera javensis (ex Hofmann et al. 2022)]BCS94312.1 MAG: hypothetical protein MjAS7_2920 [Metallosphaera javensis (ex Sakai et al. 2022)]